MTEPGQPAAPQSDAAQAEQQQRDAQQQQQQQQPPQPPPLPLTAATIAREACDLLSLPARVASTALTYVHRLPPGELPPERLAAACLFLGAKVEEAAVRTNDLLNAVSAAATLGGAAAGAAVLASAPCLVGVAYQAAKRQLILDEQLVLRRLRFDVGADQPHRHLYVLAQCWGASRAAVRAAACLLNDTVARCPGYGGEALPPPSAAAAALHLGARLCGQEVQPRGWWRAAGVSDGAMHGACGALLGLLEAEERGQELQQQQPQQAAAAAADGGAT